MFVAPDKPVTMNDLLYGQLVQSGNDVAAALAETVGGSEQAFIDQMHQSACHLGMTAAVGIAAGLRRETTAKLSASLTLFLLSGLYRLESAMAARKRRAAHATHEQDFTSAAGMVFPTAPFVHQGIRRHHGDKNTRLSWLPADGHAGDGA
jgi:hypothetical protein